MKPQMTCFRRYYVKRSGILREKIPGRRGAGPVGGCCRGENRNGGKKPSDGSNCRNRTEKEYRGCIRRLIGKQANRTVVVFVVIVVRVQGNNHRKQDGEPGGDENMKRFAIHRCPVAGLSVEENFTMSGRYHKRYVITQVSRIQESEFRIEKLYGEFFKILNSTIGPNGVVVTKSILYSD